VAIPVMHLALPMLGTADINVVALPIVTFVSAYFALPRLQGFTYVMYQDLRRRKDATIQPLPKHKTYFTVAAIVAAVPATLAVLYAGLRLALVAYAMLSGWPYGTPAQRQGLSADEWSISRSATTTKAVVPAAVLNTVPTPAAPVPQPTAPTAEVPSPVAIPTPAPATVLDTDGDGLADVDEIKIFGTDPLRADTDGDGYSDSKELFGGYDPLNATGAKLSEATLDAYAQAWARGDLHEPTLTTLKGSVVWERYQKLIGQ
jgi:hypothetical protein